MTFKELFDKEFIGESFIRKALKIFYEINFTLIKNAQETPQPAPVTTPVTPVPPTQAPTVEVPQEPIQQPETQDTGSSDDTETPDVQNINTTNPTQLPGMSNTTAGKLPGMSSVYTEEDNVVSQNDENKIIRKMKGEVQLTDDQKDNIQCFDDIIDVLAETKKEGVEILDKFSANLISLCGSQQFDKISSEVSEDSKMFVEIYYGYNKNDSIGVRFNKRNQNVTSTMLLDNEIISAKFSIDRINQKIAEYRNYEAKK